MERNKYNNIIENITGYLDDLSKICAKVVEKFNVMASSEILQTLDDFIQNIPKDIKETKFFQKVQELSKKNLQYEDVVWLIEDFGLDYTKKFWHDLVGNQKNRTDLQIYIAKIILADSIKKREKLIVLLAHMEVMIFETLKIEKNPNVKLKPTVTKITIKENDGMSVESLGKIYILAVTYIVFANTDSYTEEIDRRMPFRNNILHNGILAYSDENINVAYELLIDLIGILIYLKEQIYE